MDNIIVYLGLITLGITFIVILYDCKSESMKKPRVKKAKKVNFPGRFE